MIQNLPRVREWHNVSQQQFYEEIMPAYRPAVLRGLVGQWPAVQKARQSPAEICEYLISLDNKKRNPVVLVPPAYRGHMFYQEDMQGFNYLRNQLSITEVLEQLARYSHFERPPSAALQCAKVADCLPGFSEANYLPIVSAELGARIWIGNLFVTPAHFDEKHNIACVVSGRRRFVLFPPDQIDNLYIGPLEFTPAGAPVSLASLTQPDFDRFPKLRDALAVAEVADLEPGDAIYIPGLWWHHVESMDALNILVNYWWNEPVNSETNEVSVSPAKALLHCILSMKGLDDNQKKAWATMFMHYAFHVGHDPAAHIPADKRGVLDNLSPVAAQALFEQMFVAPPAASEQESV